MEPCITDNRSYTQHWRHYQVTHLLSLQCSGCLNCLATLHCTETGIFLFEGHRLCWSRDPTRDSLSAPMEKFCSSFTYLWFYSDTVLGCSRRVMSGFLRQPFFKIISHNENKNTFPPELSIFASEARRHGGRVKIIYHTPATCATFRSLCLLHNSAACAWPTFQMWLLCEVLNWFAFIHLESVNLWILDLGEKRGLSKIILTVNHV